MRTPVLPLAAALTALLATSACSPAHGAFTQAALDGEPFTIEQVAGEPVEKAYVFCEYTPKELAESLGFDARDFHGIDDNPGAWETETAIGTIHRDGSTSVEWFDPRKVKACTDGMHSGTEVDPGAPITVHTEQVEFTDGKTREVAVLSY